MTGTVKPLAPIGTVDDADVAADAAILLTASACDSISLSSSDTEVDAVGKRRKPIDPNGTPTRVAGVKSRCPNH